MHEFGTWRQRRSNRRRGLAAAALVGAGLLASSWAHGQEVSVDGVIESTSGGFKHPDGTTQTTAFGPGTVGTAEVVSSQVQLRVGSSCVAGSSIRAINADGTVVCESDSGEPGVLAGWERVSFDASCAHEFNCSVFVACSSGKKVLGGGLELPGLDHDAFGHLFTMTFSRPRDDSSWEVGGANDTAAPVTMRVWAVCAPALP